MYTSQDYLSGYGQKREKPYLSILPYLRNKAQESTKANITPVDKTKEPENSYNEARRSILLEE